MDNTCKLVNVVWIERGILLVMISCVIKKYTELLNKIIIIENDRYREFMKILFTTHKFQKFVQHNSNIFYFNIRKIIKMQDIVIDYANNYDDIVYTKKIDLVPWYDMNDILIYYKVDPTKMLNIKETMVSLKFFSKCPRGNFRGHAWDAYIETSILSAYAKVNGTKNASSTLKLINRFLLDEYSSAPQTVNPTRIIQYPQVYYIDKQKSKNSNEINDTIKKMEIQNEEIINGLMELISHKLNILNNIN